MLLVFLSFMRIFVTKYRELRTYTKPVFFFPCNNGFFKIVRTNLFFFLFMYFYFTSYQSSKKWDRVIEMKCSFNSSEILLWLHVPEILDIKIWFLLLGKIMLTPYSIQNFQGYSELTTFACIKATIEELMSWPWLHCCWP